MARNRIIYQSEALFVGGTGVSGTGDFTQIHRVQSANYSFDLTRQDINQFGQLASVDRLILEQPTVSLDFSYYTQSGDQEVAIGLTMEGDSAIAGILSGDDLGSPVHVKNYYIQTVGEGNDAGDGASPVSGVIGIGNGFLSSYSCAGSVGDFVSSDVSVEGLNMVFSNQTLGAVPLPTIRQSDGTSFGCPANDCTAGTGVALPAASYGTATNLPNALRHGNVTVDLETGASPTRADGTHHMKGFDEADLKPQNFSISFDLSRENLEKLGSRFAYSKEIEFPATATFDCSSIVGDQLVAKDDDMLEQFMNVADTSHNVVVSCAGFASAEKGLRYTLKAAKLDSYGLSSSIGDNKSLDATWSSQIGGPADTTHGIIIESIAVS